MVTTENFAMECYRKLRSILFPPAYMHNIEKKINEAVISYNFRVDTLYFSEKNEKKVSFDLKCQFSRIL